MRHVSIRLSLEDTSMATQIFRPDHALLLPHPTAPFCGATYDVGPRVVADESAQPDCEVSSVFRGFVFAMFFNLFLALTGAACWELWRIFRS
jgi:hypothetical protein